MGTIRKRVDERFRDGEEGLSPADVKLRLDPASSDLTECPATYWVNGSCYLLGIKTRGLPQPLLRLSREQYGPSS